MHKLSISIDTDCTSKNFMNELEDDANADTQSVFSTQTKSSFITKTFITEPKIGVFGQPLKRVENFVTRNIAVHALNYNILINSSVEMQNSLIC